MECVERFGALIQRLAADGGGDATVTIAVFAQLLESLGLFAGESQRDGQVKFLRFRHVESGDETLVFFDANDVVPALVLQLSQCITALEVPVSGESDRFFDFGTLYHFHQQPVFVGHGLSLGKRVGVSVIE